MNLQIAALLVITAGATYGVFRLFGIKAAGIVGAVGAVLAGLLAVRESGAADARKKIAKKEKRDAEQNTERARVARDDVSAAANSGKLRDEDEFERPRRMRSFSSYFLGPKRLGSDDTGNQAAQRGGQKAVRLDEIRPPLSRWQEYAASIGHPALPYETRSAYDLRKMAELGDAAGVELAAKISEHFDAL